MVQQYLYNISIATFYRSIQGRTAETSFSIHMCTSGNEEFHYIFAAIPGRLDQRCILILISVNHGTLRQEKLDESLIAARSSTMQRCETVLGLYVDLCPPG